MYKGLREVWGRHRERDKEGMEGGIDVGIEEGAEVGIGVRVEEGMEGGIRGVMKEGMYCRVWREG
jgi:hypothetical protein